ncbi:probable DNL-type zinc finger protein at C-terminar half [Coccomyxa sp. Obi]|nr:probable DNL-type zinc finger protein at C-terminar half [Coccomyxa sp. Obi]
MSALRKLGASCLSSAAKLAQQSSRASSRLRDTCRLSPAVPHVQGGHQCLQRSGIGTAVLEGQSSKAEEPAAASSSGKDMLAVFTCTKCDTRSVKPFSKRAYDHGVVIVKCPGCQSHHLLSDQLGWYGAKQNIEDILNERGENIIRRVHDDGTLELTLEELQGRAREP